MARDALETVLNPDGSVSFPNVPRTPSGEVDWAALGADPPFYDVIGRDGRRRRIDARPSVPHPVSGRPIRPT